MMFIRSPENGAVKIYLLAREPPLIGFYENIYSLSLQIHSAVPCNVVGDLSSRF